MVRKKNKKPGKLEDKEPENIPVTPPDNQPDKKTRMAVLLLIVAVLGCAAIFGMYLLNMPQSPPAQGTGSTAVTVYFFYGTECPHCQNVKPFIESLHQKYPDVNFQFLEIWHDETNNAFYKLMNHNLNQQQSGVPEVIVGDVALFGEDEITTKLEDAILDQRKNLTKPSEMVVPLSPAQPAGTNTSLTATFFYGNGCSHCENVKPLIADIQTRYPELRIERMEINDNTTNREKFLAMRLQYGLGITGSIPTIFIGESALVGETEIKDHFEEKIRAEKQLIASGSVVTLGNVTHADPSSQQVTPALSLYMVVFAALADSANPCGLSVLVFLLITMAAAASRKRILLVGGAYIAATFLFHLLVGVGLFSFFSLSGLSKIFSIIGGVIALLLGIITIADLLRNRETFFLSISASHKGLLGDYARMASLPAAFVLGILAGLLGFTCTGGIYVSILGLMGRDMTVMTGLPWLVVYNLVYVLPLVLVTLLVAYGISPKRAERWKNEHKRTLRAIIGLVLIALGLVILFGWLG